jgi:hypothetical protein
MQSGELWIQPESHSLETIGSIAMIKKFEQQTAKSRTNLIPEVLPVRLNNIASRYFQ